MKIRSLLCKYFVLLLLFPISLCALNSGEHPFDYDLHLYKIPGKNSKVMICFHGMGGSYQIADAVKKFSNIDDTLISFNFPDYRLHIQPFDAHKTSFGTIQELLPALYVLKKVVIDKGINDVNLYGFSAGGGAIINLIAVLNSSTYDRHLQEIGIKQEDKEQLLSVIQNGTIILDAPLKSIEEIIAYRGYSEDLDIISEHYRSNHMEPINVIPQLKNLALHFIVHFQIPDEILSNRDDDLFIERLKSNNLKGTTSVIIGRDGGHNVPHTSLWNYYFQEQQTYIKERQMQKFIIGLKIRTSNEHQHIDAPLLWEKFQQEKTFLKIPNKLNDRILAVYTEYEGDYSKPYSYIVGCEVKSLDQVPEGMVGITIPKADYAVFSAKGPFPRSLIQTWQKIWSANFVRAYTTDFEVYPLDFSPQKPVDIKVNIALKPIN